MTKTHKLIKKSKTEPTIKAANQHRVISFPFRPILTTSTMLLKVRRAMAKGQKKIDSKIVAKSKKIIENTKRYCHSSMVPGPFSRPRRNTKHNNFLTESYA